jgi:hypothetical protein
LCLYIFWVHVLQPSSHWWCARIWLVRVQEALTTTHQYKLLYALGLGACSYRDKLKWNEVYPHKLVAAWMRILLTSWLAMSL